MNDWGSALLAATIGPTDARNPAGANLTGRLAGATGVPT